MVYAGEDSWPGSNLLQGASCACNHVYQAVLYKPTHTPWCVQERSYGLGATCCARIQVYHASVHYKRRLVGALIRLMKQQKRRLRVGLGRVRSGGGAPFWCLGSVFSLMRRRQGPLRVIQQV